MHLTIIIFTYCQFHDYRVAIRTVVKSKGRIQMMLDRFQKISDMFHSMEMIVQHHRQVMNKSQEFY